MDDDAKIAIRRAMADDLWAVEFAKRAAPLLRKVMANENDELPSLLLDRLERLRKLEKLDR
ncbi:hypothetical protein [Hyphomicrobium denitrificans]|nr:hypothetical protein [Hyphomicrobium denitrificans]